MPQFDLSSSQKTASSQPQTLSDSNLRPPAQVQELIKGVRWDWMFNVAGNLSGRFRSVGLLCPGSPQEMKSAILMGAEPGEQATLAAAHAWVVALAQRAAMEIRQMELLEEPRVVLPHDMMEITSVAFLAATTKQAGSGKRLTKALRSVGVHMARECETSAAVPGAGFVQMLHSLPVQMVSPVGGKTALPLAAVRLRFRGFDVQHVLNALKAGMECAAAETGSEEVLVFSNLWSGE